MVTVCLKFRGTAKIFPKQLQHFNSLPAVDEGTHFSTLLPMFVMARFSSFSILSILQTGWSQLTYLPNMLILSPACPNLLCSSKSFQLLYLFKSRTSSWSFSNNYCQFYWCSSWGENRWNFLLCPLLPMSSMACIFPFRPMIHCKSILEYGPRQEPGFMFSNMDNQWL